MPVTIRHLTARQRGYVSFCYVVEIDRRQDLMFSAMREWCWEHFGASCELKFYYSQKGSWAWCSERQGLKLYFKNYKELEKLRTAFESVNFLYVPGKNPHAKI